MTTTIHPRHTTRRNAAEHARIAKRYKPSARELFAPLRDRLLASRPIVGDMRPVPGADGVRTPLRPIYGAPTFRNVVVEGAHQ